MSTFVSSERKEAPLLKQNLKRSAQVCLAYTAPLVWRWRHAALVVPMYHRVLPKGDERLLTEQPGMYVHPETFRMHVRTLKHHFEIVRLSDWIARAYSGKRLPSRACAITFDDGWRDNYQYAYPVLREEGVSATIFACSDMVGTNKSFWPERLALLLRVMDAPSRREELKQFDWLKALCPSLGSETEITVTSIDEAINLAKQSYSDDALMRRLDEAQVNFTDPALLDWGQVREMVEKGVVDIGSHTRRHVRMSRGMSERVMHDEIVESKRVLEHNTGTSVELFCYPNGNITPEADHMVRTTYRAACVTRRGWHSSTEDPFMIRRIGIHEDVAHDDAAFLSRISGLL
jgi:peptidoglycan/xylan/chitin deacetylase (PgdA/CDA1 family)